LTNFIVRYISIEYHKGQITEANSYYSTSIAACFSLASFIFVVVLFFVSKLEHVLVVPVGLINPVKCLFIIVFINFIVVTVTTPFSSSAYIKNRLDVSGVVKIIAYICEAIVLLVLFMNFEPTVWFVGMGSLIASFVTLLCNYLMVRKFTPELRFRKTQVSLRRVKDMMGNGVWNSLNQLGNVLNSGLDLIISNLMLSAVATGQIAVAKTIGVMFSTLYQVVFQPFQPQLLKVYASGDIKQFLRELKKSMKICGYFSNLAFAGFVALGPLYYKLWMPHQDTHYLYLLTVITVVGSITAGVMQPVYYVYTVTLNNKLPCWITIAGGFVNILSMYILLKYTDMGALAVVITTAVIMISINLFFNPIYAAWCLNIRVIELYKVIVRHLISAVMMIVIFGCIAMIFKPQNWIGFIISALIMCVLGAAIHLAVMTGTNYIKRTKK